MSSVSIGKKYPKNSYNLFASENSGESCGTETKSGSTYDFNADIS